MVYSRGDRLGASTLGWSGTEQLSMKVRIRYRLPPTVYFLPVSRPALGLLDPLAIVVIAVAAEAAAIHILQPIRRIPGIGCAARCRRRCTNDASCEPLTLS